MLEAWPKGLISTGYEILEAGKRLASLDFRLITFAYEADLRVGQDTYKAYARWNRAGFLSSRGKPAFFLDAQYGVVATSERKGSWPLWKYHIFCDGQEYVLGYRRALLDVPFRANFPVHQGVKPVGSIEARGPLCWKLEVRLAAEVPLLAKLFALYLATVIGSNYSPLRLCFCLNKASIRDDLFHQPTRSEG
jgi:hypothetical protein